MDEKQTLAYYLQRQRDALLWKLDGLSERQLRMPLTPTGTNLLGVVKHVISTEVEYLGAVFDRPFAEPLPWMDPQAEPNSDMWATEDQTVDWVRDFGRRAWAHADATIDALDLDAPGLVPWWPPERRNTTLHTVLVHVIAEEARHAGQLDIVRELTDGAAGMSTAHSNMPDLGDQDWSDYTARLRRLAESFD
ncbi:DinB family protein [Microlunatus elymi]|uniref:DinB family protein n=1 Tax=Microlunatus elymi TaxID=2596828 RepID=A0A516Q1Y6_9ACTN|nr:DinB family protein [Microlunatus elymi]QDP97449.1 DinB family protein [Microlunatus elymi]